MTQAPNLNQLWATLLVEELVRNDVGHFLYRSGLPQHARWWWRWRETAGLGTSSTTMSEGRRSMPWGTRA